MSYDLGTAHGKITLDYDGGPAARDADNDIKRIQRSSKDADSDLKKFGRTLGNVFGVIGKATAVTSLAVGLANGAIQAAALGVQLLGIIPVLAQIGTLAAALPAVILTGVAAVGILKAAFLGVGDAISEAFSGDLEKFNEALEKLSPQARQFAVAFREAVPALKAVQQGIQDAFFSNNLEALLPRVVAGLRSMVPTLNQISTQFGGMARQVVAFATSQASVNLIQSALNLLQRSLINLTGAIQPVLTGLRDVGRVGLEFLQPLSDRIGTLATDFGEWLSAISNGGDLLGWMQQAADTLGTLRDIAFLFGDAIGGVLQIAEQTGGGLLGTIRQIALAFNNFVDSAAGQQALTAVFTALMEVARQLAPVFTTLAGAVGSALGPALARLATNIGPLLVDTVERIAPALSPLAEAAADLLIAVAPLLPVMGQIAAVLATVLAGAVSSLTRALGPLIQVFAGALLGAWEQLMPVATELATRVLPIAAQAGLALARAFAPLVPVIIRFAQTIIDSLLPHLPELERLMVDKIVPAVVQLAQVFADQAIVALNQLIPLIPILVSAMVLLLPLFVNAVTFTLRLVAAIIQLATWVRQIPPLILMLTVGLVQLIGQALATAWSAIVSFGSRVIGFFQALPGRVLGFLAALPGMLFRLWTGAMSRMLFAIGFGIGLAVLAVTRLPGLIVRGLAALPGLLFNLFRSAWNSVVSIVTGAVSRLVGLAQSLPGRIRSGISSLGSLISSVARSAWNGLTTQFTNGVNRAVSLARQLPGKVKSGLGNLGSLLYGAGRDLIQGLINGMSSLIGKAVDIAKNAANKVKDGIMSALRIGSPSRVMYQIGEWTVEGLIGGMESLLGELGRTASTLAQTAIVPTATTVTTPAGLPTTVAVNLPPTTADTTPRTFGPYAIQVGDKTLVEIVIDAVNGNPRVVSRAAKEGDRQNSWANSGR